MRRGRCEARENARSDRRSRAPPQAAAPSQKQRDYRQCKQRREREERLDDAHHTTVNRSAIDAPVFSRPRSQPNPPSPLSSPHKPSAAKPTPLVGISAQSPIIIPQSPSVGRASIAAAGDADARATLSL
uniref:Uncharacterized protein n=1 Tax=Plectus sambesii TaxID=2011161 RepID=A0A914WFG5_9BILA